MNRKVVGTLLVIAPPAGLIGTLVGYSIVSFVLSSVITSGGGDMSSMVAMGQLVSIALGLVGILSVLGLLIGVPAGIYLLATADGKPVQKSES